MRVFVMSALVIDGLLFGFVCFFRKSWYEWYIPALEHDDSAAILGIYTGQNFNGGFGPLRVLLSPVQFWTNLVIRRWILCCYELYNEVAFITFHKVVFSRFNFWGVRGHEVASTLRPLRGLWGNQGNLRKPSFHIASQCESLPFFPAGISIINLLSLGCVSFCPAGISIINLLSL